MGNLKDEIEACREGIKQGDADAALDLGLLLIADSEYRDLQGAIDAYKQGIKMGDFRCALNLGNLLIREPEARDPQGAVDAYQAGIALGDPDAALNLGNFLATDPEAIDLQAAATAYLSGIALGDYRCATNLGRLLLNQVSGGDDRESPTLNRAERTLLQRGRELECAGRTDEALADYVRAAGLGSADAAYLAARLGRQKAAASAAKQAPPRRPSKQRGGPVFTTREDLKAHLVSLSPPPPGHVRVFRGQRRDHGSLIPAALRPGARSSHHLAIMAMAITRYLRDAATVDHPEIDNTELANLWVWTIAQHYGSGSPYLDVTRSLDVALWFALHDARRVDIGGGVGAHRTPGVNPTSPLNLQAYTYERARSPGYLYVFDLPPADLDGTRWSGELVDLAKAPKLFHESPRIKAQTAALILGRGAIEGDLSPLLVTEPLEVAWPMTGSTCASLSTLDLFPPPGIDEWYARLLALPLVHARDPGSSRLQLTQALPVALYGNDHLALRSIARRVRALEPARLFQYLIDKHEDDGHEVPFSADDTPVISLHFPIGLDTPGVTSDGWNHGIVASGLPATAPVLDLETDTTTEVSLSKVFVEFSPLEHPGWVETDLPMTYPRGAYLERNGGRFRLWVYYQEFPDRTIVAVGSLEIEFDLPGNRFLVLSDNGQVDLSEGPEVMSKVFLCVLTMLRLLASKGLLFPFPLLYAPKQGAVVGFSKDTTVLVEVDGSHLLYDKETREPIGPNWMAGTVVLACPDGWPAVDPTNPQRATDVHGNKLPPSLFDR